jgi:hypothetical protein
VVVAEVLKNKDIQLKKVYKDTEDSIYKLLSEEFGEYKITVQCPNRGYDQLTINHNDRWIRFYLSKIKFNNGSHVKIGYRGSGDFTKSEIKDMIERLNKLF